MFDGLRDKNHFSRTRTKSYGFNRLSNTKIGQRNNGFRSFGVMRHGLSPEDILDLKLPVKSVILSYIIRIALNHATKGRLDGCFREEYQVNTESIRVCFGRRIGRRLMKGLTLVLLFQSFKRFSNVTRIYNSNKITLRATHLPLRNRYSRLLESHLSIGLQTPRI